GPSEASPRSLLDATALLLQARVVAISELVEGLGRREADVDQGLDAVGAGEHWGAVGGDALVGCAGREGRDDLVAVQVHEVSRADASVAGHPRGGDHVRCREETPPAEDLEL